MTVVIPGSVVLSVVRSTLYMYMYNIIEVVEVKNKMLCKLKLGWLILYFSSSFLVPTKY